MKAEIEAITNTSTDPYIARAEHFAQPMQEHIHVPADYEDHIHQPAWNEPSRNAGPRED